jgi:hypothetical protein
VTIQTFGTSIPKFVKHAPGHMCLINREENVLVLKPYLLIQEQNVFNASNLTTGTQIKGDAFSVQVNKYMTELKDTVLLVLKMHLSSKTTSAMLALKILTMI